MMKNCPDPVDVQDIHFKLHCRLKIFENKKLDSFPVANNLISCASRYGLLFVGSNSANLQAIQTSSLENYNPKDKDICDYPHRSVTLPSPPKHISVNCDHTIFAVVIEQEKCPIAIFYDVLSFYKQKVQCLTTIRLSSNPGTFVTEIGWNPALPAFFTACKSDGSLGIYELKGLSVEINEIPTAAEVSSFCWSPKGKQIAVGSKNGTITQYKPDLKAVRMINAPPLCVSAPLISLQWVSNYQFIGIYQVLTESAKLIVVDAPKAGEVVYTNYDDVCYSGSNQNPQFFMILQHQWNMLLVASSNSAELAVLGLTSPDSWTQWIISDSSRAELPLSPDRQETLPIGLAFDISNIKPYTWGESVIAPCPYVLMLSHQGVLCVFDLVNLKNVPSICTPPDPIQDLSGLSEFQTRSSKKETTNTQSSLQFSLENQKNTQFDNTPSQQLPFQDKPLASTALQNNPTGLSQAKNLFSFTTASSQVQPTLFGESQKQSTPASSQTQPGLFGESQKQSQSLFSGQSKMTPIKIQSTPKPLMEEISITPISKSQQSTIKGPADDKYSSIFSALNTPQSSTALPLQVKPIVISTPTNKTALEKKITTPTTPVTQIPKHDVTIGIKPENTTMNKTETNFLSKHVASSLPKPEGIIVSKPAPEVSKIDTEALLQKMIKEDCFSLEAELRTLSQKTKSVNIYLGKEPDKIEMLTIIQNLEQFLEEISEISVGEHSEIHTLKQNLVLSWAWYEEALSRYNTSKDDMMKLLIKSQPLDSATEKRYTDIKKLIYYIESQLLEVSKALDEQWDKFQDYVKKTYRVQMPTMEAIYQAMVRQNAVLQKQGYILKDISSQLKKKKHRTNGGSLLLSVDNVHLEDELKRLQLNHHDNKFQLYENAVIQSKKISSNKSKKLYLLLKNREVVHVTTIKSYVPSETYKSPNKRLSLLGAKMSPVLKLLEPKQIDFSQSTPFRNSNLVPMFSNSTQMEIQQVKPLTFGKLEIPSSTTLNNMNPLTKSAPIYSFTPTTSSQLLSSNLPSAFVPTTQAIFASKEKKIWSYSIPSTTTQVPTTVISEYNTKTNDLETQKPISSVSFVAPSAKTNLPTFSFANTSNTSDITSSSNILKTPTKPNDTPVLFGNTIPKTVTTISSDTSKINKPLKTVAISTIAPIVITTSVISSKSFTGISAPVQTFGSTASAITKTKDLPESNISVSSTPVSNVFSFTPKTLPVVSTVTGSVQESSIFNVSKDITTTFCSVTETLATNSLFTSQPTFTTSSFSLTSFGPIMGSNNFTTSSTILTNSSSNLKPSSAEATSVSKILTAITSTLNAETSTTVKTTSSIIFSGVTTSSAPKVSSGSLVTTTSTLFGSTTSAGSSIFGATTTTNSNVETVTGTSLFGSSTATTSSSTPLFSPKPTNTGSLFSVTSTATTISTTPLFGTNTSVQSTSSLFGTGASPTTSLPSIFGSSGTSAFGTNTNVSSATSIFGGSNAVNVDTSTKPSSPSIFGSSSSTTAFGTSTAKTSQSIFGSAVTSQISVFGSTPTTPTSVFANTPITTSSIFGSTATTSQTSIFGSTPTTSQTSIFGSTPTTTTQTSIFESSTTSATQGSLFGGPTSQGSLFGSSAATNVTTQSSIFGSSVTSKAKPVFGSTTSSASIFASTTATNSSPFVQSATNTFGSAFEGTSNASPLATSASVFGQQSSSSFGSNTGSIFGGTPTTVTGSIFGTNASGSSTFAAVNPSGNIFGSPAASSAFNFATTPGTSGESALNFGGLNVGSATTTANSIFGGGSMFGSASSVSNPFGRTPEKPAFGGASNVFASPATTTSGFVSGSTFGANNQSSFGSTTFGSPGFGQQQQPAFGQSAFGSGSFSSNQSGPFTGGGAGVGQSGFGSPTAFQKPSSGFGSAPVFGGSPTPAFGGSPSFGGAPAFGAAPSFGSPTKIFGSNTPTAAFGSSSSAGSPGFGNLANQNTIGFGNLAKQAANSPSAGFSGNSSFSNWR